MRNKAKGIVFVVGGSTLGIRARVLCCILICLFCVALLPTCPMADSHLSKTSLTQVAMEETASSPKGEESQRKAIDDYEREKLAKLKQNIGRRLLTVKTVHPAEFFESLDDPARKLKIKAEKEGFVIVEVVQNQSGTMNFYRVKFDTGQEGYLSADGNYLEFKIKEGSLLSVPRKARAGDKSSKVLLSKAVELVKNHPTLADPVTGEKRSVEERMRDEKGTSFPRTKWKYEAKEIGKNQIRVTQYVEERSAPPFTRTWIVDPSTAQVKPENLAAKGMYR
jgi:hypothetical protein